MSGLSAAAVSLATALLLLPWYFAEGVVRGFSESRLDCCFVTGFVLERHVAGHAVVQQRGVGQALGQN